MGIFICTLSIILIIISIWKEIISCAVIGLILFPLGGFIQIELDKHNFKYQVYREVIFENKLDTIEKVLYQLNDSTIVSVDQIELR